MEDTTQLTILSLESERNLCNALATEAFYAGDEELMQLYRVAAAEAHAAAKVLRNRV